MAREPDDLEALFDQISSETLARLGSAPPVGADLAVSADSEIHSAHIENQDEFYQRIGSLTRQLHNALHELGYDQKVEQAVHTLPDTRQRLDYIAHLTGKAAERALANVEKGQELQTKIEIQSEVLFESWNKLYSCELSVDEFKSLAAQTRDFLKSTQDDVAATQALLTDIMMAQDFHDLTGQVIQKVVKLAQSMEESLLQLLVDATPPDRMPTPAHIEGHNGPVVAAQGRDDVVANQAQVDDLLESLGF